MTPQLSQLLHSAAECKKGEGIFLQKDMRRRALYAVNQGWGELWDSAGVAVFIITEQGRAVISNG